MNAQLDRQKVALVTGVFVAGWHLIWSFFVLFGLGQTLYDFVLWAHMINLEIEVGPFNLMAAIVLLLMTFVSGYAVGWVFASVWNRLHKND